MVLITIKTEKLAVDGSMTIRFSADPHLKLNLVESC